MKTIGFIGIGTMGRGMASNLAKVGFSIIAYNRTREKILDLQSDTITIANELQEITKADVVITCLPSDVAVEEILFTSNILEKIKDKTLLDCGTTSLELTEKIANACKEHNINFLDAPITGSKLGAEGGNLTFMVGGDQSTFDECESLFQAMGKKWVYCGPSTYGQRIKIALNMTQSLILESYLEGVLFARKLGVPLDAIEQVMEHSAAKSGVGSFKLAYIKNRDFEPHFLLKLMYKDLVFAQQQMDNLNLQLPLAQHIPSIFKKSMEREGEDFATIVKELEKHVGIELKH